MPKATSKITVEIPAYLKQWIDAHDVSQNALITMGLRRMYNEEVNNTPPQLMEALFKEFRKHELPF